MNVKIYINIWLYINIQIQMHTHRYNSLTRDFYNTNTNLF